MAEKPVFVRRVRAAKPRVAKHEARDDVVNGPGYCSTRN